MLTMYTLYSFPLRKGEMHSIQFHSGSNLSGGFLIPEGYFILADGVAAAEFRLKDMLHQLFLETQVLLLTLVEHE